ncbi:uncharacterized protein BDZ99DRAFT_453715 [Mytilinidion resinicola]|uniref:Pentatricopeptide repeat domain-containing protein n=1 Tax=Mytilinidion resinicola TaxID=574789 RepID=A0A6A6Y423_9PEZI|nr:uncharacterized protein BDZ99DRAFT_453715 [Mytilinidion resinicola]KAF2803400.1 hypothetical protein BDZ99DRAFT_453715 [Mytilinidion resinicola]
MPPALDRLLASPSALRVLRAIVETPNLPLGYFRSTNCCLRIASRTRNHSSNAATNLESPDQEIEDPRTETEVKSNARLLSRPRRIQLKADTPEYRLDFEYWVQLLQFQERARGLEGVREIWNGMRTREIDLPTTGFAATVLWETFVKNFDIVEEVINYASDLKMRTGLEYEALYASCIGHWLPRRKTAAYKFHKSLIRKLAPNKKSLRDVLPRFAKTARTGHLDTLRTIYLENSERDVYDTFIPTLYQRDRSRAQEWHNFLIKHNDIPSRSLAGSPMTPVRTVDRDELAMRPDSIIESFSPNHLRGAQSEKPKFNREIMSRLLGESHHVKPKKEFDDSFCARLFATRAFSPTSVIKGLGMFGIEAIGPLALREMGLRTHPLDEMPRRFRELKEAGVTIGRSVFSKAIEKFTVENRLDLVRDLLESDQHPDVLEDTKVQEELLSFFISKEDWRQVHRTLAILTIFHADPNVESWNLMLRAHSKSTSGTEVNRVLKDMHAHGVEVTHLSLNHLHANILRRRNPSKRPVYRYGDRFDDLRFLAKIWLRILQNGGHIEPWRWREILRRFGMTGRIRELQRLVLWLAAWYSPRKASQTLSAFSMPVSPAKLPSLIAPDVPPSHPAHPYQKLFPPSFQEALVEWGFKSGLAHNSKRERSLARRRGLHLPAKIKPVRWTDGLEILVELCEQGVFVKDSTIKKAIQTRIVILYGSGVSNRKENRMARKRNPWMWQDMIRRAEEVWGRRLFRWPGREEEEDDSGERSKKKRKKKKEKGNDESSRARERLLKRQQSGMRELRGFLRK